MGNTRKIYRNGAEKSKISGYEIRRHLADLLLANEELKEYAESKGIEFERHNRYEYCAVFKGFMRIECYFHEDFFDVCPPSGKSTSKSRAFFTKHQLNPALNRIEKIERTEKQTIYRYNVVENNSYVNLDKTMKDIEIICKTVIDTLAAGEK